MHRQSSRSIHDQSFSREAAAVSGQAYQLLGTQQKIMVSPEGATRHVGRRDCTGAWRRVAIVVVFASLGLTSCGRHEKPSLKRKAPITYPPEVQPFIDKCVQIKVGMGEKEVDELFKGHHSHTHKLPDDDPITNLGGIGKLPRPCTSIKTYDEKRRANESDYYFSVYLDDQQIVVYAYISQYIK
jgi:hypothetical protein